MAACAWLCFVLADNSGLGVNDIKLGSAWSAASTNAVHARSVVVSSPSCKAVKGSTAVVRLLTHSCCAAVALPVRRSSADGSECLEPRLVGLRAGSPHMTRVGSLGATSAVGPPSSAAFSPHPKARVMEPFCVASSSTRCCEMPAASSTPHRSEITCRQGGKA